jgi:SNF2 family DNA or RNA helicase
MVSITTAGTVDEHLDDMKRQKAKHIKAVMEESKKLSQEELLRMFDPIEKTHETIGSDSEDD